MGETVAVVGGTGRLGRHIVAALASERRTIRILTRDPSNALRLLRGMGVDHANIVYIQGDPQRYDAMQELFAPGSDGRNAAVTRVVAVAKEGEPPYLFYHSIMQILFHARSSVDQVVMVSEAGTSRPWRLRTVLTNIFGDMRLAWYQKAEDLVRRSGLSYVIVKPGEVGADGAKHGVLDQEDASTKCCPSAASPAKLSPEAVAHLCADAARHDNRFLTVNVAGCEGSTEHSGYQLPLLLDDIPAIPSREDVFLLHNTAAVCISALLVTLPALVCGTAWAILVAVYGSAALPGISTKTQVVTLVLLVVGALSTLLLALFLRRSLFGCCCSSTVIGALHPFRDQWVSRRYFPLDTKPTGSSYVPDTAHSC